MKIVMGRGVCHFTLPTRASAIILILQQHSEVVRLTSPTDKQAQHDKLVAILRAGLQLCCVVGIEIEEGCKIDDGGISSWV